MMFCKIRARLSELTNKNYLILYKGLTKKDSNQVTAVFNNQWVARGSNPGPTD